MSYMLSLQIMYPFRDIFTIIKKRLIFCSMLNFGDTVAIVESEMSLHAGQVKKLLQGQIFIAKVTLERAPSLCLSILCSPIPRVIKMISSYMFIKYIRISMIDINVGLIIMYTCYTYHYNYIIIRLCIYIMYRQAAWSATYIIPG